MLLLTMANIRTPNDATQDFMKLTGKATPKLVTKDGAEGRLFRIVAWLTGMKNALKG